MIFNLPVRLITEWMGLEIYRAREIRSLGDDCPPISLEGYGGARVCADRRHWREPVAHHPNMVTAATFGRVSAMPLSCPVTSSEMIKQRQDNIRPAQQTGQAAYDNGVLDHVGTSERGNYGSNEIVNIKTIVVSQGAGE